MTNTAVTLVFEGPSREIIKKILDNYQDMPDVFSLTLEISGGKKV